MKTILIVEDMAIFRDPISVCLSVKGYDVATAAHGGEAMAVLMARKVDLILLDLGMPVMDGLSFLEALHRDASLPKPPIILLTAMSEKDYVIRAAKFGVRDYLLKSRFSLTELLARIEERLSKPLPVPIPIPAAPPEKPRKSQPSHSFPAAAAQPAKAAVTAAPAAEVKAEPVMVKTEYHLAPGEVRRLLTGDKCLVRVQKAMSAMRLSVAASKLIALATSPAAHEADVISAIDRDRTLGSRVLGVINAVRPAPPDAKPLLMVSDGVDEMGMPPVRDFALACAVYGAMPQLAVAPASVGWANAIGAGMIAQHLVGADTPGAGPTAFLAGLCQGLGDILLRVYFEEENRLVTEAQLATGRGREEVERAMLGLTTAQLNDMVLQDLGVPGVIRRAVMLSQQTETGKRSSAHEPVERVLRLAVAYANGILPDSLGSSLLSLFSRKHVRAATGQEKPPAVEDAKVVADAFRLCNALGHVQSLPTAPTTKPRVAVFKDPALSSLDPVLAALQSRAEVQVAEALPSSAASLDNVQGCVILGRTAGAAGFDSKAITTFFGNTAMKKLWLLERNDGTAGLIGETELRPTFCPLPFAHLMRFVDACRPAGGADGMQSTPATKADHAALKAAA